MYIFISYSSKNTDDATRMCRLLEQSGQKCFLAYRDIEGGSIYAEELINALDKADAGLLLLTEGANSSPHVLREMERACSKRLPIVVYKLEDVELSKGMEYFLMTHQWITYDKHSDERVRDVFRDMAARKAEEASESATLEIPKEDAGADGKNTKKSFWKYIAAVGAVACLAAIVLLTVHCLNRNSENDASDDPGEVTVTTEPQNDVKTDEPRQISEVALRVSQTEIGGSVSIGEYNGEPVEWTVLHRNEDGSSILISKKILCLKLFDAAESGEYGSCFDEELLGGESFEGQYWTSSKGELDPGILIQAYGSNNWYSSNIRTWLNSGAELVSYSDTAPGKKAVPDFCLYYDDEPGFLMSFSEEEKAALTEYSYKTSASDGSELTCSDKVFLLSEAELAWFSEAELNPLAKVTDSAVKNDPEKAYENYNENGYYYWWLRDGDEEVPCKTKLVTPELDNPVISYLCSYYGYGGIRPCICVGP